MDFLTNVLLGSGFLFAWMTWTLVSRVGSFPRKPGDRRIGKDRYLRRARSGAVLVYSDTRDRTGFWASGILMAAITIILIGLG